MIAKSYNGRGQNLSRSSAHLKRRKLKSSLFAGLCFAVTALAFVLLVWLLWGIWRDGAGSLSWDFLKSFPSRRAEAAGIMSALFATLWVVSFAALFSVPIGIGAAIYLQEYAENNRFAHFAQVNIANLAGVPSIVYGILGLALFVR